MAKSVTYHVIFYCLDCQSDSYSCIPIAIYYHNWDGELVLQSVNIYFFIAVTVKVIPIVASPLPFSIITERQEGVGGNEFCDSFAVNK